VLLMGIRSDWLYPPGTIAALAERIAALEKDVTYVELDSPHGHDAFLKEWEMLTGIIAPFVQSAFAGVDAS
jgi:homoserine O-acetyltransferase/O-succinyltransferase